MSVDIEPQATTTIAYDGTDADFIDVLITRFGVSVDWNVNNSQAGTGITIEQATAPSFQINIRINGGGIKVLFNTGTGITNATNLTGVDANASPEVEFVPLTTLADALIVNEYTDYLGIYQRTDLVVPPSLKQGIEIGIGVSPHWGSDLTRGMNGEMIAVGDVNPGTSSTNNMYTTSTTSKTYLRTATAVWENFELQDGTTPGGGDIDTQEIGGVTEPIPVTLELNIVAASVGRPIGTHKYLFGVAGTARQACFVIDDNANSKQIMTLGNTTSASFRVCIGVRDGFDPTAPP